MVRDQVQKEANLIAEQTQDDVQPKVISENVEPTVLATDPVVEAKQIEEVQNGSKGEVLGKRVEGEKSEQDLNAEKENIQSNDNKTSAVNGAGKETEEPSNKKAKTGLSVGDEIIDFELETDQSSEENPHKVSIKDIVKDNGAILFFYPKASTPGCTTQACGFRDDFEAYKKKGYQIIGISADEPTSQASWKSQNNFQYTLLSDPEHEVLSQLGVSSGKKINRSHIIIEKGGKVKDIRIAISPAESLKFAKELVLDEN